MPQCGERKKLFCPRCEKEQGERTITAHTGGKRNETNSGKHIAMLRSASSLSWVWGSNRVQRHPDFKKAYPRGCSPNGDLGLYKAHLSSLSRTPVVLQAQPKCQWTWWLGKRMYCTQFCHTTQFGSPALQVKRLQPAPVPRQPRSPARPGLLNVCAVEDTKKAQTLQQQTEEQRKQERGCNFT